MIERNVASELKKARITESGFRKTEEFEKVHSKAEKIESQIAKLNLLKKLREVSNYVFKIYERNDLKSLTGRSYLVNSQHSFRN